MSATITVTKEQLVIFAKLYAFINEDKETSTLLEKFIVEPTIEKVEPTIAVFEEVVPTKVVELPIEKKLNQYEQFDLDSKIKSAMFNYERVGICIINKISEIPILVKGDKGIKDERKIDIKCAIAKVLGYYVKGKEVYSPHHTKLTNKITYRFKANEPNAGEQLQVEANDFKQYLIKLENYKGFDSKLEAYRTKRALELEDDTDTEIEPLNVPKPHFTAKEVVQHLEAKKPIITYPYTLDSKAKKIKVGTGSITPCVGFYDMDRETQDKYIQWWYNVGQKYLTSEIADITI